jgi:hypothetical protein
MMAQGRGVTMPPLTVPERHRPGLAAIVKLTPDAVDGLISALTQASSSSASTESVLAKMPSGLTDLPDSALEAIVRTILSLYTLRVRSEQPATELAEDIVDAVMDGEYPSLHITDEEGAELHDKLTNLLSIDPLAYRLKTTDVMTQHERWLCSARILTDIRPIFGMTPDSEPVDAVIIHTLKITYHDGTGSTTKDIFFAMDDETIQDLRDILERADMKSHRLKGMMKRIGSGHVE